MNGLAKKRDYNSKISEIEDKTPNIAGLATTAALTIVENKTKKNVLLRLIIANLRMLYLMQRQKMEFVGKSAIAGFINNYS